MSALGPSTTVFDGASVGVRLVAAPDTAGSASSTTTSARTTAMVGSRAPNVPALRDEGVQGMTELEQHRTAEVALADVGTL